MRRVCQQQIEQLADLDDRVVFIGSDLAPDTLATMKQRHPSRHYMEGISEQAIIGMAAGMALDGYIPFVMTIASFLTQRCYEQIAVDLCMADLPVRLIGIGGGGVYAPLGPTHTAFNDIAIMRSLPNMTVIAVSDAKEMAMMMQHTLNWPHPIYIRLAKGGDAIVSNYPEEDFSIGKGIAMFDSLSNADLVLCATGIMTQIARDVALQLQQHDLRVQVLHLHTVTPLDVDLLQSWLARCRYMVVLEEHYITAGFGSAVLEAMQQHTPDLIHKIRSLGISHQYQFYYGSQNQLLQHNQLDVDTLTEQLQLLCMEG